LGSKQRVKGRRLVKSFGRKLAGGAV
jgi:hypothetical protein